MESDIGKLFIGGISWDTNEERLREYFKNYGEVVEAVIMKDRTTGRARGFGFVVFADPTVAERVVMEKHMIDGRMVEAKKAVPRDDQHILNQNNSSVHSSPGPARTKKIFVGGLASTLSETDFKKYFDQFGTITDAVVMYDHHTRRPRGFGFITYDSEDAVDKVLVKTFHDLNGKMVEVKRAVPKELSPGPNMRLPIGGYKYGMNRSNSFLNAYNSGYSPSSIGGYGMRMDGRFGALASGRNGFPFGPGYGIGMNIDPAISPSYGGSSSYSNNIGYGRGLNPYYSGNSSRYNSPIGYGGGNVNAGSVINSVTRNAWGNSGLAYNTNAANSIAYTASGSGRLGGFANSDLNWGGSSPISAHGVGGGSGYVSGSLGYGSGENNFGLVGSNYGRSSGTGSANTSLAASSGGFEGNYSDLYGGNSVYGDPTWRSGSSDLDNSGPFSYGLGNSTTDATAKSSAGYIGGYTVTNRQPNRVSQLHASLSDGRAVHEKKRAKCSQEQPASNLQLKNLICRKCWQVILGCTPLSVFSGNKGRRKLDGKPAYLSRAIKNKAVLFFLGGYILFRRSMHEHTSGHLRTSQEKKRAKYSQGQPTGSQQLRHSSP